jgi:3-oxoacyl-[acyl-carrier protein] reductase
MSGETGRLAGKVALVTGASRGIGRAVALALAEQGVDVALNYRENQTEAETVIAEMNKHGHRCIAVKADVSKNENVLRIREQVKRELGVVQILVNNAGISRPQDIKAISEEDWDELIDVNLKSAFLVSQAFLPDMRELHWGRIVNMSSVAAQLGGVVGPHYAASKAGLIGLTHSYAHLMSKEGITVNAIAPALIGTEMVTKNPHAHAQIIPVGRFGTAEEVAGVVLMLVNNGYITGQTIGVNGGWYMT